MRPLGSLELCLLYSKRIGATQPGDGGLDQPHPSPTRLSTLLAHLFPAHFLPPATLPLPRIARAPSEFGWRMSGNGGASAQHPWAGAVASVVPIALALVQARRVGPRAFCGLCPEKGMRRCWGGPGNHAPEPDGKKLCFETPSAIKGQKCP